MTKLTVILAACLLCSGTAFAQTHPCDVVGAPTSGSVVPSTPVVLTVCSDNKDANGTAQPVTGWALYDNAVRSVQTFVAGTTSPVSGKTVYTFNFVAPSTAGVRTYQVAALAGAVEGGKSLPFVLTVALAAGPPSVPTQLQVK